MAIFFACFGILLILLSFSILYKDVKCGEKAMLRTVKTHTYYVCIGSAIFVFAFGNIISNHAETNARGKSMPYYWLEDKTSIQWKTLVRIPGRKEYVVRGDDNECYYVASSTDLLDYFVIKSSRTIPTIEDELRFPPPEEDDEKEQNQ